METRELSVQNVLSALTAYETNQRQNNEQMSVLVGQMAQMMIAQQSAIDRLEKMLQSKVTITAAQAKAVQAAAKERAAELCDKYALPYDKAGRTFREGITKGLKVEFTVTDLHDLPQYQYDAALDYVREWSSFATVRRIRERLKG